MFYIFVSLLNLSVDVSPPVATHWNHRLPAVNPLAVKYRFTSHNNNYCSLTPQTIISIYCIVKLHCTALVNQPYQWQDPCRLRWHRWNRFCHSSLPSGWQSSDGGRWLQASLGLSQAFQWWLTGSPVMAHSVLVIVTHPSRGSRGLYRVSQHVRRPAATLTCVFVNKPLCDFSWDLMIYLCIFGDA